MKNRILTISFLTFVVFGCFAQKDTNRHEPIFTVFASPFTFQTQSPAELNKLLVKTGYSKAEKNFLSSIPVRLTFVVNKKMIALERTFDEGFTKKNDLGSTIVNSSFSTLQFGYNISKSSDFRLYPILGFGKMRYSAEIANNINKSTSFEELSNNKAANRTKIYASSPIIDFGLEIQSNFVATLPFRLSLKTGYRLALKKVTWQTDYEINNSPRENLSSFYVQLGYGFGKPKSK